MTMQVKCPNGSCGKLLTVQEEYAGKKGKCPSCGNELTIPASANGNGDGEARQAEPTQRSERHEPVPPMVAPVVRSREMADHALPAGRRSEDLTTNQTPTGLMTRAALGVGICCLALLSFAPKMDWIFLTGPKAHGATPNTPVVVRPDAASRETVIGDAFLDIRTASADFRFCSLAVAVLASVALMLTPTGQRELTDGAIAASGSIAVGWAVVAGIWQFGIVWKVFALATFVHDQQVFGGQRNPEMGIWPGPGIALGLIAALIVVVVFGSLVASRKRFLWLLTGVAAGLVIGCLLLVFYVKPMQEFGQ